jgi:hypothetical protein
MHVLLWYWLRRGTFVEGYVTHPLHWRWTGLILRYRTFVHNWQGGKIVKIFFVPWIVHMCNMVTLGGNGNALNPVKHISIVQCTWLLTPNLIGNIFFPWVVHMYDLMSVSGKDNTLELSTLMSRALDLWLLTSNSIWNIFPTWVVHMCGMVTLGGKGDILEPENLIST